MKNERISDFMKKTLFILLVVLAAPILADDYENGKKALKEKNYSEAVKLLNKACDGGSGGACYTLGVLYNFGQGVKRDFDTGSKLHGKAAELLTKECDSGSGESCFILGRMYFSGMKPVKKSWTHAKELYKKACDLKHQKACSEYDKEFNNKK